MAGMEETHDELDEIKEEDMDWDHLEEIENRFENNDFTLEDLEYMLSFPEGMRIDIQVCINLLTKVIYGLIGYLKNKESLEK